MRELFGGAVECSLPDTFVDVSTFRELPDSEEVLVESETDASLIVEILELQEHIPDSQIAKFHFDNIADENETEYAEVSHLETIPRPEQRFGALFCAVGTQKGIVKFRESDRIGNDIVLYVAVARIKELNAEVVISLSAPATISRASSSHAQGSKPDVGRAAMVWADVVRSFSIRDYGLFA
jgi:hypothetical protein